MEALRAARLAIIAMALLFAVVASVLGTFWLAYYLGGLWGAVALWLTIVFGVLWVCAMLDIRQKGGRK